MNEVDPVQGETETSAEKYMEDTTLSQIYYLENRRVEPIPHTEREAWNRARSGFKFPTYFEIGSLGYLDLIEISQYPPDVNLREYKELQPLDREQLLKKAAGIEHFYPTVSKSNLFFYLTRGWLPEDMEISEKIRRWKQFNALLDVSQFLLLLLYPTQKQFAEATFSHRYPNLESLIALYDELLGLKNTPGVIASMAGIAIVTNTLDMDNYLYDKLYFYIQAFANQVPTSDSSANTAAEVLTLEEVIGMNRDEWKDFIARNYPGQTLPYTSRSDFVMQTFYRLNY